MTNNSHTPHTIFWADDDSDDLALFREVVEAHAPDHQMHEFCNGQELLSALKQLPEHQLPCLIVLDMNMPVFSGRETLQQLKTDPAFQHLPVVMFTTSGSPADQAFCDTYQTDMVTKPPTYAHLKELVVRFVHRCDSAPQA